MEFENSGGRGRGCSVTDPGGALSRGWESLQFDSPVPRAPARGRAAAAAQTHHPLRQSPRLLPTPPPLPHPSPQNIALRDQQGALCRHQGDWPAP